MHLYTIIIASNDLHYNQLLVDRLSSQFNFSAQIELIADESPNRTAAKSQIRALSGSSVYLFLGTADEYCSGNCQVCLNRDDCKFYIYNQECLNNQINICGQYRFCKYNDKNYSKNNLIEWPAAASQIYSILKEILAVTIERHDKTNTESDNSGEGQLCMLLQMSSDSNSDLLDIMKKQIKQGYKIYYLALMPGWLMRYCCEPDSTGPDISSLLLSIHQHCQPEPEKIGIYVQLHPEGYFQFRPPVRGDDIISCEPDTLRQLLLLVRNRVKTEDKSTLCWIDCRDLSIQTSGRLAALCDHLLVDIPSDSGFAAICARKELGQLLAGLPGSCNIAENKEQIFERLGSIR